MNFNTRPAQDALLDSTSVAWDTAARWWAVLGGQRALLLQVAHPQVAAAVSEHSNWEARSLQRLVATLRAMLRLSFGSASAASDQAEALGRVHGSIVGRTDDGVGYDADDPDAQAWVLATLIDSLWEVERRFVGRLSETDRNRSVTETRMLARSFNIDLDRFPADATEFRAWFSSRAEALQPDDRSRLRRARSSTRRCVGCLALPSGLARCWHAICSPNSAGSTRVAGGEARRGGQDSGLAAAGQAGHSAFASDAHPQSAGAVEPSGVIRPEPGGSAASARSTNR